MTYTPYHSPWHDEPVEDTPITAAALDYIEAGIVAASIGGGDGQGITEYAITGSTTPGVSNSVVLNRTPDITVVPGEFVLVSAYTTNAELRQVSTVVGTTVTLTETLLSPHAAGDLMVVINHETGVTPPLYGLLPNTADWWGPLQRCVIETCNAATRFQNTGALLGIMYRTSEPIGVPSGSQWENIGIKTHSSFTMADPDGALVMVGQTAVAVTAAASTNVISGVVTSGPGSYSEIHNTAIMFNNPYGETMPGGITAGKVYFIKTTPTTNTITISTTRGGAELNITSDGAAWAYHMIDELTRTYWDNIRFETNTADTNLCRVNMQQPSYIRGLRLEMNVACTVRTYGLVIGGQIGYVDNVEAVPHTNCTAIFCYGTGIRLRGVNATGHGSGTNAVGIEFNNCDNGGVSDLWTESMDIGVLISSGRGIFIAGGWEHSPPSSTAPALKVTSATSSYDCGNLRVPAGGDRVLEDVERSIILTSYGATDVNTCTDETFMCPGFSQLGTIGFLFDMPPRIKNRNSIWVTANYSCKYIDENVNVSSNTGSRTITLPTAVGWIGHQFRVGHYEFSGANTCTVATTGGQTIDGNPTLAIPQGGTATLVSDGGNWQIQSERA